jgi:hypothetical protein
MIWPIFLCRRVTLLEQLAENLQIWVLGGKLQAVLLLTLTRLSLKLKYILLTILALFLLGAGYYFYTRVLHKEESDAWSFIPSHAVWVYETSRAADVWAGLQEQPAGEVLQHLPAFQQTARYRNELDSLAGGALETFLENRRLLSSLHITGKNSFDYLFYLPVQGPQDYSVLKNILDAYQSNPDFSYGKRVYQGFDIEEFTKTAGKERFSYLIYQNHFIGSFTPFLVEDVIRQLSEKERTGNFRQNHAALFQLSTLSGDEGNLYVNGERFGAFLNLFLNDTHFSTSFSFASKLDVAVKEEGVLLNGYTTPDSGRQETPYLQSLLGEQPQPLGMAHLLPLRTAVLQFYGFGNGENWHQLLLTQGAVPKWEQIVQQHSRVVGVVEELGSSIALARWRNPGEEIQEQLLYIELKQGQESAAKWEYLARSMSEAAGDSLYQETFGDHTITLVPYEGLPEAIFGAAFTGFKESFYVQLDNYLVLGNSIQGIKSLLLDVERDNTWRKSVPMYQFLEKTNKEMNWGYFVNLEQAWRQLTEAAEPEWKDFLEEQRPYLLQFNHFALQLSALDDLFYTNALLEANPQDVRNSQQIRFTRLYTSRLEAPVAGRPMPVRSSERQSQEILVQDSLYQLHLLDTEGDSIAGDSLGGPLVGKIFQLETDRRGALGYLAVTPGQLYLYDAAFQLQPAYPLTLPEGATVQWTNVIDYNGSKNYRILLADSTGDIYMLDTQGNILPGWQPRTLAGALSTAPGHIRVRGKDIIYAYQQKGLINMLNRRGESYKGFPLNVKDSLLGPVLVRPGADFKSTRFTTITKEGELLSFNMLGQIIGQEQLFKPEVDAKFRLVSDEQENTYLIVRQSRNRMSLLDNKGELLFEKDYLGAARIIVQYFNFGADKELIAITDPLEEFTFVYDKQGNLLNAEPLSSCCPLTIQYLDKENSFLIYKGYQDELTVLKVAD